MPRAEMRDVESTVERTLQEKWEQIWEKSRITFHDYLFDPYLGIENGDLTPHVRVILREAGGLVLEAGCGTGGWMEWIDCHGYRAVGLDYADQTLRWLHARRPAFQLTLGDVRHLPYSDGAFAVVMSWGVLEHFPDQRDFRRALEESHRVLRDDGWLCITVPYLNWIRQIKRPYRFVKDRARALLKGVDLRNEFFEYKFSYATLKHLIRSAGFGLTSEFPFERYRRKRADGEYAGVIGLGARILEMTRRWPQFAAHMVFVGAQKAPGGRGTIHPRRE